jgi:hypothetical protein
MMSSEIPMLPTCQWFYAFFAFVNKHTFRYTRFIRLPGCKNGSPENWSSYPDEYNAIHMEIRTL